MILVIYYTIINGSAIMSTEDNKKKWTDERFENPVVCAMERPISGSPVWFFVFSIGLVSFLNQPTHSWTVKLGTVYILTVVLYPKSFPLSLSTVCV